MHEVSLMQNLLTAVEKAAKKEGEDHVRKIRLRIGEMAGVSIDALSFAFEVLSKETVSEGGRLEFEMVPLVLRCSGCGSESQPDSFSLRCPLCGSPDIKMVSGREIEVDYIELGDEEDGVEE